MKYLSAFLIIMMATISSQAQELYFPPNDSDQWETIDPTTLGWCQNEIDELYSFLDDTNSKSFILLKDGKIVLEQYFDGFNQDSSWYWASAAKTLTSFLTGIAQEQGHFNIDDKSSDILGEGWTSMDQEKENLITIRNQITMTTGMDESEGDCLTPDCFTYKADAGDRWFYHNGPYTKMRHVIEEATGQDYNVYSYQNLLTPTGMTGLWIWINDNNVFFSNARSMARFGLLNLADGVWDDQIILGDQDYISAMKNSSQSLNKSYGYLWWLNGKESYVLPGLDFVFNGMLNENAPEDLFSGIGKDGQIVDISPSLGIVVVRMGANPDNSLVPVNYHRNLWEKISNVMCTSSVSQITSDKKWEISPNPFDNEIIIQDFTSGMNAIIINSMGQVVTTTSNGTIPTSLLESGVYLVRLQDGKHSYTQKMIKI